MGTYFVAVAWIFSIVKINSRLSYGNLSSQVKLHIKIWQDDLCSNMNITTIFKKGLFYSKIKYLWYDCQLSAFTLITDNQLYTADYKIFDYKFVLPMKKPRSRVIFNTAKAAQPVQMVIFMFSNRLKARPCTRRVHNCTVK